MRQYMQGHSADPYSMSDSENLSQHHYFLLLASAKCGDNEGK